jgi:hypothetical protein
MTPGGVAAGWPASAAAQGSALFRVLQVALALPPVLQVRRLKPIGYTWSYLACRIGHSVPIWQPSWPLGEEGPRQCPVPVVSPQPADEASLAGSARRGTEGGWMRRRSNSNLRAWSRSSRQLWSMHSSGERLRSLALRSAHHVCFCTAPHGPWRKRSGCCIAGCNGGRPGSLCCRLLLASAWHAGHGALAYERRRMSRYGSLRFLIIAATNGTRLECRIGYLDPVLFTCMQCNVWAAELLPSCRRPVCHP